jgi:hypothetical protein
MGGAIDVAAIAGPPNKISISSNNWSHNFQQFIKNQTHRNVAAIQLSHPTMKLTTAILAVTMVAPVASKMLSKYLPNVGRCQLLPLPQCILLSPVWPAPPDSRAHSHKSCRTPVSRRTRGVAEGRELGPCPAGKGKGGKDPKGKGAEISEKRIPARGALKSSTAPTFIFNEGIFELFAECLVNNEVALFLEITNTGCEPISCIADYEDEGGIVSFDVPIGSSFITRDIWDNFGFPSNDIDDGAFYCSDGSYLGWTGETLIGASASFNSAAFGGADCIFAGTFEYQK